MISLPFGRRLLPLLLLLTLVPMLPLWAQNRELAWSIGYDPKTFDPAKVDEQASETVRYLTAGVLLRTNRLTQELEPSLASAWSVSPDGRIITLRLRDRLQFSDGTPLLANDAACSIRRVLAPETSAPVAEEFLSPREVTVTTPDAGTVMVHLPKRVVGIGRIFDEIAIEPANRPSAGRVTAGPYRIADYRRGQWVRLERNPHYWKHDPAGLPLPYIATIRLDVVGNPEQEQARFVRGDYALLPTVSPEYFNPLARKIPAAMRDLGPSLNTEQLWFNQAPGSPLPDYEKQWFRSSAFRRAVSGAIHREDLARVAFGGHATPAYSFISPANKIWYNSQLLPVREDVSAASALLAQAGFHRAGATLYDAGGHPVRFSILTNAGNHAREKMATMLQQDLAVLGMQVTVVALDFPALVERLMTTSDYEACLLGLSNVDADPNAAMNLWLSSSPNHQWNPSERTPATPWEAAIDAEMRTEATAPDLKTRKRAVDHVQQIVADQQPFIYLVYPNALYGVSPALDGISLSVLQPGAVWNIETLRWKGTKR